MNKEDDPKYLKKKIKDLEKTIYTQARLIEILRSMPGCKQVTYEAELKKEKALEKKAKKKKTKKTGAKRGRKPKAEQEIPQNSQDGSCQDLGGTRTTIKGIGSSEKS